MSKRTYRIKIKNGYFIDNLYESPVDKHQLRFRRNLFWFILMLLAICLIWAFLYFS
jgi:hypothetical protein